MSKMDNLRAMREARYAEATARAAKQAATGATRASTPRAPVAPAATPKPAQADPPADATADSAPDEALCGHKNMGGRTCTREKGHAAKSHRYS